MDESAPKLADNIISLDRAWLGPLGDYIWDGCVSSLGGLCCDLRKSQLHLFLFEAVALIFLLYSSIEVRFPQLSSWRTTHLCFGSVSHYFLLQIDFASGVGVGHLASGLSDGNPEPLQKRLGYTPVSGLKIKNTGFSLEVLAQNDCNGNDWQWYIYTHIHIYVCMHACMYVYDWRISLGHTTLDNPFLLGVFVWVYNKILAKTIFRAHLFHCSLFFLIFVFFFSVSLFSLCFLRSWNQNIPIWWCVRLIWLWKIRYIYIYTHVV